jgi:ecdysteroid 25-hydroxylase CYP306A1
MWELIAEYLFLNFNFDKLFFSFITLVILGAAILDYRDKNYPPGPMGLPFLGYLPFLNSKAPYLTLSELAQQYGRVFSVHFGSAYAVIVADVKLIREALNDENFDGRPPLFLSSGTDKNCGITSSDCERWKEHRRFVSSALRDIAVVKQGSKKSIMEEQIQRCAQDLVKDLRKNLGNGVDIIPHLRHSVGLAMMKIVLGTRFDKTNADWKLLQDTYEAGRKVSSVTGTLNYVPWLRRFSNSEAITFFEEGLERSHKIYEEIMNKQARTLNAKNISCVLDAYMVEMKNRDGGSEEGKFTKEQVHHVLSDLIGAGWESSMATLKWLFFYMAIYPDVQEKVSEEIRKLAKNPEAEVTLEDMKKLPYTEATIMEIWRHRSIVPLGIPHETNKDGKLGEYLIPKGTLILPLFWAVNHDTRLWEKPDIFSPERFLDQSGELYPNDNLVQFQSGKRVCLGEDLGRTVVQLFFTNAMKSFAISLPKGFTCRPEDTPECGMTLVPRPYDLQLDARL